MADEPYLLVSLEEEKSKKLAQVLSNDTSRKILDYMSKKEYVTETEVAKELKIPLSTAHYNLDLLLKTDLINGDQFKYSEKGKKIVHYALSNKYVIIAPRKSTALFERLKEFIPVLFLSAIGALGVKYFFMPKSLQPETFGLMIAAEESIQDTAGASLKMAAEIVPLQNEPNIALWFFIGAVFSVAAYILVMMFCKKRSK